MQKDHILDSRFRGNDRRGCLLRASTRLAHRGVLSRCSRMPPGAGVSPGCFVLPQEWGIKGVEKEFQGSAGGFRSALPTLPA